MSNHLTLWIPGLRPGRQFASELSRVPKTELPELTNLNHILSRSDRIDATDVIQHDFILQQLGEDDDQQNNWPQARWRLALEKSAFSSGNNQWLCADPVYIHPDRSEALLFAHEELDIELDEAIQLARVSRPAP